jgi:tetratricopeptide (TPR) repeat protein
MKLASIILFACAISAAFVQSANSAPYKPANDTDVLEQLPWQSGSSADRITRAMSTLLARDPKNLDVALRLAQIYVARARSESDPRQLGHAQAVLAPWWNDMEPPVQVLMIRATIRQSTHLFDQAHADLEQLIARDPTNAQAWLTLATVQQVTGDIEGAKRSCEKLSAVSTASVETVCAAAVDGVSGQAQRAYESIEQLASDPKALGDSSSVKTWVMTLRAELAERLGRSDEADHWYRASLAIDQNDAYTIAAYADFLLDANRPSDVVALIHDDTPVDVLLLRRAQADRQLASADQNKSARDLADRFAALQERGDRVHLREQARFTLAIEKNPKAALELALQNWAVQKEPLDARIVLECAIAADQPQAAEPVARWIAQTHLQGERLDALLREVHAR